MTLKRATGLVLFAGPPIGIVAVEVYAFGWITLLVLAVLFGVAGIMVFGAGLMR